MVLDLGLGSRAGRGGYCNVMWVGIVCMLRVSYNPVVVCWPGCAMVVESRHRDAWVIGSID